MHFTLRQDDFKNKKTDSAIDIFDNKIVISDWEFTPRLEDYFGKDDMEWNYEIELSQIDIMIDELKKIVDKIPVAELSKEEIDFYASIEKENVKSIFLYLLSYFRNRDKAIWLIEELKSKGIKIADSSY